MNKYKIMYEAKGKMIVKDIEANDLNDAKMIARRFGKVIKVEKKSGFKFEPALEMPDRQIILLRLSAMAASKVSTGEALALMEDNFSGTIKRICGRLLKLVENGSDLSQAMETIGAPHFPPSVVALVQAGFRGGNTPAALKNAAQFEAEMDGIRRGNMGEIYSGIMGFLSAVAITFGTTRYMAPEMAKSDLMKMAGKDAQAPVFEILASISEVSMGISGLAFVILVILGTLGRKVSPVSADKIIMKIPFYKDLILARNNYTTLYSLSLLINSGVPIESALSLSADTAAPGSMRQDLQNAVANVRQGKPWAKGMTNLHPTDRAALGASLDRAGIIASLDALSSQYKQLYASRIATLAPMIKGVSALFLIMSGAVLFGLTIMPILKMASKGF
jgi:type II secretory pathway component PulF